MARSWSVCECSRFNDCILMVEELQIKKKKEVLSLTFIVSAVSSTYY